MTRRQGRAALGRQFQRPLADRRDDRRARSRPCAAGRARLRAAALANASRALGGADREGRCRHADARAVRWCADALALLGLLGLAGGLLTLGTGVVIHFLTLPTELDASFMRALPLLQQHGVIRRRGSAARAAAADGGGLHLRRRRTAELAEHRALVGDPAPLAPRVATALPPLRREAASKTPPPRASGH